MTREDLLDLNEVLQHPGRTITVEIATEFENEEDLDLLRPLEGELTAVSTGNILLLTGHFATTMVLECDRCGSPVEVELAFEVDEQFTVTGTASSLSSSDMAKVESDEPYPLFEENNLIVETLLRQDLIVNTPVRVTCPEGTCQYKEVAVDNKPNLRPELQGLAERFKEMENES